MDGTAILSIRKKLHSQHFFEIILSLSLALVEMTEGQRDF